jgi:hypothetical protein
MKKNTEKEFEGKLEKLKIHKNLFEQYQHTGTSIECLNKMLNETPKYRMEVKFTPMEANLLGSNLIIDKGIDKAFVLSMIQILSNYQNTLKANILMNKDIILVKK